MSQTFKLFSIYLTVLLMAVIIEGRPHCDMTEQYADECGKKLIFIGEHTTKLPENDAEMKTHCATIDSGLQCLKRYAKSCLDPFATQMMNIMVKNGDKMEQKYCKDDKGRAELLGHLKCNEQTPERVGKLHMCMDKFIVEMEHLADVNGDHRISATCCSFHVMDQCVTDNLNQVCNKPESVKFIRNFLTEMTGEIVKTGCGKFDSLAHCDANMDKKEWATLRDLVSSDDPAVIKSKREHDSPFVALKNVMKQLMEE